MELDAIEFTKKTGNEAFIGDKQNRTLLEFWKWAYSDLVGNTEKGSIAEYLVAIACGIDETARISWDTYDLTLKNGIKIEVKSSGYVQTWKQKRLSIPVFNIPKTKAWDYLNNFFEPEKKRHADLYVFALLAHIDKKTINPLNTSQWEFYILNTQTLNKEMKNTKQITLKKLIEINAIKSTFEQLHDNILFATTL